MHVWNWQDICKPKSEGGVELRRIKDMNQASCIRLVWRLCTQHTLWSQWMKAQYMKEIHISNVTTSLLDPGTWKWICSLKSQALSNMGIINENGLVTVGNAKWKWTCTSTGFFYFKSAWNLIRLRELIFSWQILFGSLFTVQKWLYAC